LNLSLSLSLSLSLCPYSIFLHVFVRSSGLSDGWLAPVEFAASKHVTPQKEGNNRSHNATRAFQDPSRVSTSGRMILGWLLAATSGECTFRQRAAGSEVAHQLMARTGTELHSRTNSSVLARMHVQLPHFSVQLCRLGNLGTTRPSESVLSSHFTCVSSV